ncbi:hypothetical protein HDU79_007267, partial [Rhizoclosmatium sp. JEL0117]
MRKETQKAKLRKPNLGVATRIVSQIIKKRSVLHENHIICQVGISAREMRYSSLCLSRAARDTSSTAVQASLINEDGLEYTIPVAVSDDLRSFYLKDMKSDIIATVQELIDMKYSENISDFDFSLEPAEGDIQVLAPYDPVFNIPELLDVHNLAFAR